MDGLKLSIESASGFEEQGRYYNSWTHGHYVSAVIVFCPDGTIPIVAYNCPGSVHDSMVAEWGGVYDKLEKVYDRYGGKCTPLIPRLAPLGMTFSLSHYIINSEATSMRQSAEWGYGSPAVLIPEDEGDFRERKLVLRMRFLLINYRSNRDVFVQASLLRKRN